MKTWIKNNRGLIAFVLCLGLFRTGIADWNPIPTGSMRPTLLEGDVVFVNRLAYDLKVPLTDIVVAHLGEPKRGDIVTFASPQDGTRLIKRIIGLPGDRVEMRNDTLIINGQAALYSDPQTTTEPGAHGAGLEALRVTESLAGETRRIQLLPEVQARRTFGPIVVPQGHYLMLGDNRDNSADSRYFGLVPRRLLIGQARRILVSADIIGSWAPRLQRFGQPLD